ncbi:MAG TPA: hypothetical protein VMY41_07395 [Thermohalobaculum sp.]|nr:hypothetical protein [Thermohalobaculum sp.]
MRAGLLRFLRILSASTFCGWIFWAAVIEIHLRYFEPGEFSDRLVYDAVLATMLHLIRYFYYDLAIIFTVSIIHFAMDRFDVRRLWVHIFLWMIYGTVSSSISRVEFIVAVPVAALAGAIYWVLAGRVAGETVSR